MRLRTVLVTCTLFLSAEALEAQSLEDRVSSLEAQVAELWSVYQEQAFAHGYVPAELVGNEHLRWGYPGGDCQVLFNDYFITCHANGKRIPEWVSYHLTSEYLTGDVERTEDFRPDPELHEGSRAELSDYLNSGYDRGHMAPAGAFKRSVDAMSQTFLLSNMAPQTPSLNRQMWRMLEEDVRELASESANTWVFTGALFLDEHGSPAEDTTFIGANEVAVPTHFYKVILVDTAAYGAYGASAAYAAYPAYAAHAAALFAVLMPNQHRQLEGAPEDYLVSVDLVEALSGLDFFSALTDTVEETLEEQTAAHWR